MAHALLTPEAGTTWTAPYYRLVRYSDVYIRVGTEVGAETVGLIAVDTTWPASKHALTLTAIAGVYPLTLPALTGDWKILVYEQAGATAAATDTLLATADITDGTQLMNNRFDYKTAGQIEAINS